MIIVLAAVAVGAFDAPAAGCERCRLLGTTAFHEAIGGDAFDDALVAPPVDLINPDEEGWASSNFVAFTGWPQPGGKGSLVTLTYSYQNMFDGGLKMPNGEPLPALLIRRSIEEALGLWAGVAPLRFVEVEDDGLAYNQGSTQYGQIRFRHLYINGPDPPPPALPTTKARAYFPFASQPRAGDVEFDHGDPWQEIGTIPVPDILGAAIHELGHSLGLGHSSLPRANMYWIFTRTSGLGTSSLDPDDIAGIQSIYGAGVGEVVPLPLPVPEPATWVLMATLVVVAFRRSRRRFDRKPQPNRLHHGR